MVDFPLGALVGRRIQQAMPAERKSSACEAAVDIGASICSLSEMSRKKTRPSAQYDANGLASPGH
jgi:hypothetical protein